MKGTRLLYVNAPFGVCLYVKRTSLDTTDKTAEDSADLTDCELRPQILIESTMKFLRFIRSFVRSLVGGANGNRPFRPFLSSLRFSRILVRRRPWVGLYRCIPPSLTIPEKSRISALNLPLSLPIFLLFIGNVTVDKRERSLDFVSVWVGVGGKKGQLCF